MMLLQAITIDDRAYEVEKATSSFINQLIFPGGCLPSVREIQRLKDELAKANAELERIRKRLARLDALEPRFRAGSRSAEGPPIDGPDFVHTLELLTRVDLLPGHETQLFVCGDETYPHLWDDLRGAQAELSRGMAGGADPDRECARTQAHGAAVDKGCLHMTVSPPGSFRPSRTLMVMCFTSFSLT